MNRRIAVWLVAGVLGCAPAFQPPPSTITPAERQQVRDAAQAIQRAEEELGALRLDGPAPSCERLCGLQATICDLAGRICAIADRQAHEAEIAARCNDSKGRCQRAQKMVAARCACGR